MSDSLHEFRSSHIGRALARAHRHFEDRMLSELHVAGFDDFRHADARLLSHVPTSSGVGITQLAAAVGVSKQAVSKQVASLSTRGYVRTEADPADRRAQRVVLSERGRMLLRCAERATSDLERSWSEIVGSDSLELIRKKLLELSDAVETEC